MGPAADHPPNTAPEGDRRLIALAGVVLALALAYVVSLLPVVRGEPGLRPLFDIWLNIVVKAGVVAVLALRGWLDRRMRAAWWALAAGLFFALLGSIGYFAHLRHLDPVPFPSYADAGFIAFYVLAYAAILIMLRERLTAFHKSMWLDGVIAASTAAAFAAAFVLEPATRSTGGSAAAVATTLAYPVADLLLVTLLAGGFVLVGAPGRTWGWLAAGLFLFFVTDALYVNAAATGSYDGGEPLDIGWTVARMCFVLGALQAFRRQAPMRWDSMRTLVAPALCAAAALGLLYYGTREELPATAATLALIGAAAALARTALAFRELRQLAESRRQASTDELTGLLNRRAFLRALRRATAGTPRRQSAAVLLLDLDRFKDVNDSLGHATGDELLRLIATRLGAVLGARDVLGRLGGDEFAVITPVVDERGALRVAARLGQALADPFAVGAATLHASASIGIALAPQQSESADELMQLADLAMYAAKDSGSDALIYDELRDGPGRRRLELVAELRRAIPAGELFLEYQPKISLASGRMDGVEALVRWRHPERGVLGPQHFVELAESSGAMPQLTATVLDLACAQRRRWADAGLELSVAVNISPSDLLDGSFPEQVERRMLDHGLPPGALIVEITEQHVMEDRERTAHVLGRLRAIGVGVAVDDFGTGYSSLVYLAELPLTEVKLDRAFVSPMLDSPRASSIVRSTVQLATALDLVVVAEGVEDSATLEALREVGCEQAQGFYIGRPTTAEAVVAAGTRA